MKKIFLIFLLLMIIGCSSVTKITETNVVKGSGELLAKIEKVENNERVFLELENRTNDVLGIKLSESTINNKEILDIDKMMTNDFNNMTNINNMNNPDYYGGYFYEIDEKAGDILLNPKERVVIEIGTRNLGFPMKVVIKYIRNAKIDFVSLQVEDTGIEIID